MRNWKLGRSIYYLMSVKLPDVTVVNNRLWNFKVLQSRNLWEELKEYGVQISFEQESFSMKSGIFIVCLFIEGIPRPFSHETLSRNGKLKALWKPFSSRNQTVASTYLYSEPSHWVTDLNEVRIDRVDIHTSNFPKLVIRHESWLCR